MAFERHLSELPGWATSLEAIELVREDQEQSFEVRLAENPHFVIATIALPGALWQTGQVGRIALHAGGISWSESQNTETTYVDERGTLFILNGVQQQQWRIDVEALGPLPVELHFMAFHSTRRAGLAPPQVTPPPPSGRCRIRKITAKALALAIVAAASLPALPAALISAVATYLGATTVVAAAFISSVLGDTVDMIAEKLCTRVGLCP